MLRQTRARLSDAIFGFGRKAALLFVTMLALLASATTAFAASPACTALNGDSGSLLGGVSNPLWIGNKQFWPGDVLRVNFDNNILNLNGFNPNWSGGSSGISWSDNLGSGTGVDYKYQADFSAYRNTVLSIEVVNNGIGYTLTCTSNPPPEPAITALSPTQGPTTGGLSITITGTDFTGFTGVKFGTTSATVMAWTSTSITVALPPHAAGAVDVSVTTPVGTGTLDDGFTYIAPGKLSVTGPSSLAATGPYGGPFTPDAATWTLTNTGGTAISVVATGSGDDFFDITGVTLGTPVTLAPAASVDVTLTLDAGTAPVGSFFNTLSFTNSTNGDGDTSVPILLAVGPATSSVTLAVNVLGSDAVFGFTSATSALNVAVTSSGGRGASPAIGLPPGTYTVTADDMSGMGYGLMDIACTDGDSSGDTVSRTATIALAASEAVTCSFTLVNTHEATTDLIEDFLETSSRLLLGNLPDAGRRIGRLNGVVSGGGDPVGGALNYVSGILGSGSANLSASLSAIEALTGTAQPSPFDAWLEGSFALLDGTAGTGRFGRIALGADYLVTPDLLVGGFLQIDHLAQDAAAGPATASGTGWLAGPYMTARLGDNLYLDLLAAAGRAANSVSPLGTYTDSFGATRWLLSAALEGEWSAGKWSFVPRARLGYAGERSDAYTDSLGVPIPAVATGMGEVSIGPGLRYTDTLSDGTTFQLGVQLDGAAELTGAGIGNPHARLEAGIGLGLPGGAQLDVTASVDGIGSGTQRALGGRIALRAPFG